MLARGLLDAVSASKDGRIVFLGSEAHRKYSDKHMTFTYLDTINKERPYLQRYGTCPVERIFVNVIGQAKLAVVLLAQELSARTSDRRIFINSVNPGDVATGHPPLPPPHAPRHLQVNKC